MELYRAVGAVAIVKMLQPPLCYSYSCSWFACAFLLERRFARIFGRGGDNVPSFP
jgi:hypothetical protein